MTNKPLLCLLALLCWGSMLHAQYNRNENKIWIFGAQSGINFNGGTPVPFTRAIGTTNGGSSASQEGSATLADANGNFLFHTDGAMVWDAANVKMPHAGGNTSFGNNMLGFNGTIGNPAYSTAQSAIISPVPDSAGQYFIFSITDYNNTAANKERLFCNKIRMDLNNGLGDVDTTFPLRHKAVDSLLTERMTIVAGPCFKWLLVYTRDTNSFKAYRITNDGLDPNPVISYAGNFPKTSLTVYHYRQGTLKASPDGRLLANAMFKPNNAAGAGLELYDFDQKTGVVSNARILDEIGYYAAEFSPDNSKLYATSNVANNETNQVYQFDLSNPNRDSIRNSKFPVGTCSMLSDIRLAPDGKLYFARKFGNYSAGNRALCSIEDPNEKGALANYRDSAILLPTGTGILIGLPHIAIMEDRGVENNLVMDTSFCYGFTPFALHAPAGSRFINWNDGSGADSLLVNREGTYHVSYLNRCHYTDTFKITVGAPQLNVALDTSVCPGFEPFSLYAPDSSNSVTWNDGTQNDSLLVSKEGTYYISYTNRCAYVDTFKVHIDFPEWFITVNEMLLGCSRTFDRYQWYQDGVVIPGAAQSTYTVQENAVYTLKVFNSSCDDTLSHKVNNANSVYDVNEQGVGVRLYPNPVRDILHIDTPFPVVFSLLDMTGKELIRLADATDADLTGIAAGVYLVRLQNPEKNFLYTGTLIRK